MNVSEAELKIQARVNREQTLLQADNHSHIERRVVRLPQRRARHITDKLVAEFENIVLQDEIGTQEERLAHAGFTWEEVEAITAIPGMEQRLLQRSRLRMLLPASPRVIRRIVKLCDSNNEQVALRAHEMYLRLVADTSPLKAKLEEKIDDLSDPAALARAKQLLATLTNAIQAAEKKH